MKKMIILAVMMVITTAMPAMAGNKKHTNHDKNDKVLAVQATRGRAVVVTNDKKVSHFDRSATKGDACQSKNVDKRTSHFDAHKHAYRPDVKACTFKVSRHDSHRKVVAKVEHMKGVMDTKWNPRTRELTVIYDAKVTSARHILHFMA